MGFEVGRNDGRNDGFRLISLGVDSGSLDFDDFVVPFPFPFPFESDSALDGNNDVVQLGKELIEDGAFAELTLDDFVIPFPFPFPFPLSLSFPFPFPISFPFPFPFPLSFPFPFPFPYEPEGAFDDGLQLGKELNLGTSVGIIDSDGSKDGLGYSEGVLEG